MTELELQDAIEALKRDAFGSQADLAKVSISGSAISESWLTCSPDCYQSEVESGSFMMVA
jgi:hypothetical protein